MKKEQTKGHFFRKFFSLLFAGLTATLPFFLTIFIIYKTFSFIDGISAGPISKFTKTQIPGLGFIITISALCLIGFIARQYLGQKVIVWMESIVLKIPLAQLIYSGAKDISDILSKKSRDRFTQVVSVPFPPGASSIGFLTKDHISIDDKDMQAVFVPTTPNPFNGFLFFVHKSKLKVLDINVDTAVKVIVTMGAVSPDVITALAEPSDKESNLPEHEVPS